MGWTHGKWHVDDDGVLWQWFKKARVLAMSVAVMLPDGTWVWSRGEIRNVRLIDVSKIDRQPWDTGQPTAPSGEGTGEQG